MITNVGVHVCYQVYCRALLYFAFDHFLDRSTETTRNGNIIMYKIKFALMI
jgi:hypothetical protein